MFSSPNFLKVELTNKGIFQANRLKLDEVLAREMSVKLLLDTGIAYQGSTFSKISLAKKTKRNK